MPLKALTPSISKPLTLPAVVVASGVGSAGSAQAVFLHCRASDAVAIAELRRKFRRLICFIEHP
jgi:hypothetical protein